LLGLKAGEPIQFLTLAYAVVVVLLILVLLPRL
jgi:hypothetical protein